MSNSYIDPRVRHSMNQELDSLIDRLKAIQIKQQQLLSEQSSITAQIAEIRAGTTPTAVHSSRVLTYLQGTQATEPKRGDRVFITNLRGSSKRNKAAVITAVFKDRIEIKTYSGNFTWHKPKNLRRLLPSEHLELSNDPY